MFFILISFALLAKSVWLLHMYKPIYYNKLLTMIPKGSPAVELCLSFILNRFKLELCKSKKFSSCQFYNNLLPWKHINHTKKWFGSLSAHYIDFFKGPLDWLSFYFKRQAILFNSYFQSVDKTCNQILLSKNNFKM